ncbi:spore germination protein GerW family protein, partial [Xanthovirga aplysinae]|uniref:spore germination protein GerW family protein n=1 Tax=Xanthovirga aplysinae TaxID=2529853 RepID=UPI0012BD054D
TVIPVARVMYGFGGGAGAKQKEGGNKEDSGLGLGGGVAACPEGLVIVDERGAQFVSYKKKAQLLMVAGTSFMVGYLVGKIFLKLS